MDIQPSWAVFWQQQRQQGHCQHILVARHSSLCSGTQGCLKQQFCHSHRIKFCLHCWEVLRHLVQTIHWLGRRELGAADVLVHPSLLWAAQGDALQKQGSTSIFCCPFLLHHASSQIILSGVLQATSFPLLCTLLLFTPVPVNVFNIFWNLLMTSINSTSCSN